MHKISSLTGQAKHELTRMTPGFGLSRAHQDVPLRRPHGPPGVITATSPESTVHLSFNVPFSSNLPGPELDEVLHGSPSALQRWIMPSGTPEDTPLHKLPVHASNVENLRKLCKHISEQSGGRLEAIVTSSEPKAVQALQRRAHGLVTNVCISGDGDLVHKMRAKILNETPISLVRLWTTK